MASRIVDGFSMNALSPYVLLLATWGVSLSSTAQDAGFLNLDRFAMKGFTRLEQLQRTGNQDVFEDESQVSLGSNVDAKLDLDWAYHDFSIQTISYGKYRSQYHSTDSDLKYDADVREWVFGYESENWQYRLGKQQVAWGKGDYFRIIDVINPLNLTEALIPYLDDYSLGRLPREMLVVEHFQVDVEYQFITAFHTERTKLAETDTDFSVEGLPTDSQRDSTDNVDLAVRARFFIDGTDLDLYAFSGYNPDSLFTLEAQNAQLVAQENLEKRNVLAVSFARPIPIGVLRSDVAYYLDESLQSGNDFERVSKLDSLIGLDIQENEWTFNLQATVSQIYRQSDQFIPQDNIKSASVLVQKEWSQLRLMSSLVWLYSDLNQSSNMLKYNVRYDWRSDSQFEFGVIVFDGPADSMHGMYDDQDRLYLNFKQSFDF